MTIENQYLPRANVPITDPATGLPTRPWYLWASNIQGATTPADGTVGDLAVQVAFDGDNTSQVSELTKIIKLIDTSATDPFAVTGTVRYVNATSPSGVLSVGGVPYQNNGTITHTWAGTSGGVPYFSSTSAMASSALLGSTQVVLGGGAGAAPNTSANLTFSGSLLNVTGAVTVSGNLTNSALTAGRVPFASTAGLIVDNSGFTFNTTGGILTVGAINVAGTTAPTVGWYNPTGTQIRTPNSVRVDSLVGVNVAPTAGTQMRVIASALTGTSQRAMDFTAQSTSAATGTTIGVIGLAATEASSYTCAEVINFYSLNAAAGAGSTQTKRTGFYTDSLTSGTNNYGFRTLQAAGTNNWALYAEGTAKSFHSGNLQIGSSTETAGAEKLQVTGTASISSTLAVTGVLSANTIAVLSGTTATVYNTTATTVNAFGAATTLNVGASTGTMTVANTTLAAKAITASTTLVVTGAASNAVGNTASASTNLNLAAGTTSASSVRLPHGAAPSAPVNGDMWTTTAGLYVRINGATVGPLT